MRLIDADSLITNMNKGMQGTEREYLKFYQMAVNDEPTAYDVDKVVQKIEDRIKLLQLARIPKSAKIAANNAFLMAIEDIKSVASDERVIKNEI